MRRARLLMAALLLALAAQTVNAVPAWRGPIKAKQPDGSVITFYMTGDEFGHQCFALDGTTLVQDSLGFYRKAPANRQLSPANSQLSNKGRLKAPKTTRFQVDGFPTTGEIRCLVILAEFNNLPFTFDYDFHNRMLNETGFSDDGATGCAAEYFTEQSMQTFFPKFDVIGPVKLTKNYAYYGENDVFTNSDTGTGLMIMEACQLAKSQHGVNFADYDNNNDGQVDMVYVIYAGYGESWGAGSNYLWPKKWQLAAENLKLEIDNKTIDVYACSSEFYGNPSWEEENGGHHSAGIGTVCHEFGHVLGFADHYSTAETVYRLGSYDIMDYGPYNNLGHTPPAYNAFERVTLGWMTPDTLRMDPLTNVELEHIATSNKAYVLTTSNPNECYFLEARQQEGWDRYLPSSGMMITHLDFQTVSWTMNMANTDPDHQRFYLVCADNDPVYDFQTGRDSERGDLYPSVLTGNKAFTDESHPAAWTYTGEVLDKWITNIRNSDGIVLFDYRNNHLEIPVNLHVRDINNEGFTAEWEPVDRAERYELNLYQLMHESDRPLAVNEGFWRMEAGSVSSPDGTNIADKLDDYMTQPGWTGELVYQAGGLCKIGSAGASGKLISPKLNLASQGQTDFTVVVKVQSVQGKTPVLSISCNGEQARTRLSSANREYYATFHGGLTETTIEIESVKERAFLDTLVVIRGTNVTDYFPSAKEISVTGDIASTESPEVSDPLIPCDTINVETTDTQYLFTGLLPATNYCFEVRAMNNDMGSAFCDRVYVCTTDDAGETGIVDRNYSYSNICPAQGQFDLQGRKYTQPSTGQLIIVSDGDRFRKLIMK
ncbi:MAG: M6 family metalloprotease domain-containing protein [Prevotella sp.]|nr:M6 family metalloprotease domain-containing protein [Prevotella sp.]